MTDVYYDSPDFNGNSFSGNSFESNHSDSTYSESHKRLTEALSKDPVMQRRQVNLNTDDTAEFMKHYEYAISSWPVIISQSLKADFDQFNAQLPGLIYKALTTFFAGDSAKFAQYLNVPPMLLELLSSKAFDLRELINRHDIVFTAGQFKLLEVNAGLTIGGWQHDWVHGLYSQLLDEYDVTAQWQLRYCPVIETLFSAVLKSVQRRQKAGAQGTVLFANYFDVPQYRDDPNARQYLALEECMSDAFAKVKHQTYPQGQLIFCHDFEQVEFAKDGAVVFQGQVIDAVLLPLVPGVELSQSIYLKLMSSFLQGHIVFPDSPLHTLFGNKHILNLLHEPALKPHLTVAEQALIDAHIPWSTRLRTGDVEFKGKVAPLATLLLSEKDQLVLKKSRSWQGTDVYIGRFTQDDEWADVVKRLVEHCEDENAPESDWLVQEFCPPDVLPACDLQQGMVPHQMVWGVFDFDNAYAGAFVRGVRVSEQVGVINSANGATEFVVFEEPDDSIAQAELEDTDSSIVSATDIDTNNATVEDIILLCQQHDVSLEVNDGQLDVLFDDELPDELLPLLKQHKASLIDFLSKHQSTDVQTDSPIPLIDRSTGAFALSFAQQRLWFVDQLEQGIANFNMTSAIEVEGAFDLSVAEQAIRQIIERHEPLRTVFAEQDGEPVQIIQTTFDFAVRQFDLSAVDALEYQAQINQAITNEQQTAFNLQTDIMVRASFYRLAAMRGVLIFTVHHIASDGWSLGILVNEFVAHYQAIKSHQPAPLDPLTVQYVDYAKWQRQQLSSDNLAAQLAYWQSQLADAPHVHSLPLDYPRQQSVSQEAGVVTTTLSTDTTPPLLALANEKQMTLFMLLHAVLGLVLSRHSNSQDLLIGTVVANRKHLALEPLIGFFVNTLVLRTSTNFEDFDSYLAHVKQVNLDAQTHQDVLLEQLVEQLEVAQSLEHMRLVQIVFSMNTAESGNLQLPGLKFNQMARHSDAGAKFDLEISASIVDGALQISWIYDKSIFAVERVQGFATHFQSMIESVVEKAAVADLNGRMLPLTDLSMLSEREIADLTDKVNPTTEISNITSAPIDVLFSAQAKACPQTIAIQTSISKGNAAQLSYQSLEQKSNQLAHYLMLKGIKPGALVGLCLRPCADLFVGFLAVLKAGATCVPIDPDYPQARREHMVNDSGLCLLLTHQAYVDESYVDESYVDQANYICLDDTQVKDSIATQVDTIPSKQTAVEDIAYVIYTSGSTGLPKGVMITHANWCAYLDSAKHQYAVAGGSRILQFSSVAFDIFIEEISLSLLSGGTLVLQTEDTLPGSPEFWQLVKTAEIDVATLPTAYWHQLCADDSLSEHCTDTSLKTLILGGEAMSANHLSRWIDATQNQNIAVFNTYGPTETTVIATCFDATTKPIEQGQVPIGKPILNSQIVLLDVNQQLVPFGAVGEIYIAGPSVGPGYLNNPQASKTSYQMVTLPSAEPVLMFKTGDLAKYLPDGNIQFVGRIDDQVKIRGFRIELAEVEYHINAQPSVRECVVIVQKSDSGHQRLLAYVVASVQTLNEQLPEQLKAALSANLPDYMVPAAIAVLPELPLTTNGKVDKQKLPDITVLSTLATLATQSSQPVAKQYAPKSNNEWLLAELWADLLAVPLESVSMDADFFASGGDSLLVIRLLSQVKSHFNQQVSLRRFFANPTLNMLAETLKDASLSSSLLASSSQQLLTPPITPVSSEQTLVASTQQQRLWLLQSLNENDGGAYNIYQAFTLEGKLEVDKLHSAFATIIERHQVLRTSFTMMDSQVIQQVNPDYGDFFVQLDISADPEDQIDDQLIDILAQNSRYVFDLTGECLLRCVLIKLAPQRHVLMIVAHHIAADGWSVSVLINELNQLYRGLVADNKQACEVELPQLPVQYSDYSVWQAEQLKPSQTNMVRMLSYWTHQLDGLPQCHNLSLDKPRPARQTFAGEVVQQPLGSALYDKAKGFAKANNVTLFMVLQSAFAVLLSRYSQSDDIVMGTPVANRENPSLDNLVGCFINTLVLRNQIPQGADFHQLVAQSAEMILQGFEHQSLPFETLVEHLKPQRSTAFSPLFQIMFVLHNNAKCSLELPSIEVGFKQSKNASAKFDLTLNCFDLDDDLSIGWEFNTALFERTSIAQMALHFTHLLDNLLDAPDTPVSRVSLFAQQAVETIESVSNATAITTALPSVHQLFEASVKQHPEAIAVIEGEEQLSYRAINQRANQLARYCISQGIGADSKVGVMLEHHSNMLVCLLALMKVGACYVPMDILAPMARLNQIIAAADIGCLFCESETRLPSIVNLHPASLDLTPYSSSNLDQPIDSNQLAYILFTSGSTGTPKGVEIEQRAFANLLLSMQKRPGFSRDDRLLAVTPLTFDISGLELFLPLISGGTLVLGAHPYVTDGERLTQFIEQHQITVMQATPTMWRVLIGSNWQGKTDLKALSGGEAITQELTSHLSAKTGQLWNMYGPTETTIWSFCGQIGGVDYPLANTASSTVVHVGRPIDNTFFAVLDEAYQPVPAGVPGQLYIGGAGLARGYLNQPTLTAETFISAPWSEQQRLYATGDLVRLTTTGDLVFLSRIDSQIKLRGFRIEPGEIESVLNRHPNISDSLATVCTRSLGETDTRQELVAYYTNVNSSQNNNHAHSGEDTTLSVQALRSYLAEHLPSYMIPSIFMPLSHFALTSSGKKDHKQLPEPKLSRQALPSHLVNPQNELESFIVERLKALLHIDVIGIEDNFFEIGATSVDLVQLADSLSTKLKRKISAVDLFDKTTTKRLAEYLDLDTSDDAATSAHSTTDRPARTAQLAKARDRLKTRAKRKSNR